MKRKRSVEDLVKVKLSRIIIEDMSDPNLGIVSITGVDMSSDLKYADVYISVLGDREDRDENLGILNNASSFLRGRLADALTLKYTPEIRFKLDPGVERGRRIENKLKEIQKDNQDD